MTTVEEIERAVEQLAPHELARFRLWFEAFDAGSCGGIIEQDARAGILAVLAEEAMTVPEATPKL
jgi:hypothetical protein